MGLESATYINGLVATNPTGTDPKSQGDDHIRLIKAATLATWANVTGAVLASHTQMNYLVGVTSAIQTQLDAKGAIAGQAWAGAHDYTGGALTVSTQSQGDNSTKAASTAYVDTGLALKASLAGATATGTWNLTGATVTVPTASPGDNSNKSASTAYVDAAAFASALPSQSGNSGKFVKTDGTVASWADPFPSQTGNANKVLTTNGTSLSWSVAPSAPDVIASSAGSGAISTGTTDLALTTLDRNVSSVGTLSSGALILPAGQWVLRAKSSLTNGNTGTSTAALRIRNSTDATDVTTGGSETAVWATGEVAGGSVPLSAIAVVTLAATKTIKLQTVVSASTGSGGASSGATTLEASRVG